MMEMIISFCPRNTFKMPGIMAHRPPNTAPARRQRRMAGRPVRPVRVAI